jgi:nucleotide-binding universal stress UspA family protein
MFEKILIPLDGSELAEVALPYAEEGAGKLGSEITLISVLISPGGEDEGSYHHLHRFYLEKMVDVVKQELEKKLGVSAAKKIKVKSIILVGDPAEEIVDYAEKEKVGLIIMSTHGLTGLKRWAVGSVAYKVVKAAPVPVALIRAKGARSDIRRRDIFKKILVPLDGSKESETIIPYVEEIAAKLKTEVVLFQTLASGYYNMSPKGHDISPEQREESDRAIALGLHDTLPTKNDWVIYTDQQMESSKDIAKGYLDKVGAGLKRQGVAVRAEVRFGDTAGEIIKFADEIQADLVAMSGQGHSGVGKIPREGIVNLGSVAEKIVHSGNTPLMLVKPVKK